MVFVFFNTVFDYYLALVRLGLFLGLTLDVVLSSIE